MCFVNLASTWNLGQSDWDPYNGKFLVFVFVLFFFNEVSLNSLTRVSSYESKESVPLALRATFSWKLQCTTVPTYIDSLHGTEISHSDKVKRIWFV